MKNIFSKILVLATLVSISPIAFAEDCWDATYAVGGYNLYSFGVDMYNTYDYCAPVEPVCCDSCYDSPTLYTYNNDATIQQLTQMVYTNQQLINQLYGNPNQMPIPGVTGPGFGIPPYTGPGLGTVPPMLGNPGNPYYPPVAGIPPYYPTNPVYPTTNPIYRSNPIYPSYPPITTYPVNPIPTNPSLPRPPSLPPYGGCDNITVMCPFTPGTPGTPPSSLPQNPNLAPGYQTNTNQVGQDPTRYRVPRGGKRNLSH